MGPKHRHVAGPFYDGNLRSADDVHAMSLANLQGEYADVVSTEQLLKKFSSH